MESDETRDRNSQKPAAVAEFVGVWLLVVALFLCPAISGPALSGEGRFGFSTRLWLWLLCFLALAAGALAFRIHARNSLKAGEVPSRTVGRFALHAAVTLGIVIATAVAADLLLATVRPLPVSAHLDVPKAQIYGWAFAPRQPITIVNPDNPKEVYREQTNWMGWRDVEHPVEKTRPRVLIIGDSQVYGFGVPLDQTIGGHLRRALGNRYEFIVVGVSGWGTDQQYLFLENEGWGYEPDVVVLVFTVANDVMNNMYDREFFKTARKPIFRLEGDRLVLTPLPGNRPPPLRRLFSRSAICRRIRLWAMIRRHGAGHAHFQYARIAGERPPLNIADGHLEDLDHDYSPYCIFLGDWSERLTEGWRVTLRLVEEIDRGCRERGATLLLYATGQPLPDAEPMTLEHRGKKYRLDWHKPFRLLREFCRENEIPYLEEPPEFQNRFWAGELTFKKDQHLTPEGNREAAKVIETWLRRLDEATSRAQ